MVCQITGNFYQVKNSKQVYVKADVSNMLCSDFMFLLYWAFCSTRHIKSVMWTETFRKYVIIIKGMPDIRKVLPSFMYILTEN